MKKLLLFGILVVNASFFAFNANAQFASGTGTVADPYVITTASQLNDVRTYLTSSFKLGNDIDLNDWITTNSPTTGWTPIGTATNYFSGNLDGDGHFITGLWINLPTTNYVGLFGVVSGDGTVVIKNLGLKIPDGKSIIGQNDVGGFVGYITKASATQILNINNCCVIGTLSGTLNVGALVGYNNWSKPTLQNCYAIGSVTSSTDGAGGLIGNNYGGIAIVIDKCYAANSVTAGSNYTAGGILGGTSASTASSINLTISNCVATNPTLSGKAGSTFRIYGYAKTGAVITLTNNFAFDGTLVNGAVVTSGTAINQSGLNKTRTELISQSTYDTWDFSGVWALSNVNYPLPALKNLSLIYQPSTLPSYLDPGLGTKVNNVSDSKIKVSFNSQSGTVLVEGKPTETLVSIYDHQGRLLLKSQESVITISNFSNGIYLVNLSGHTTKIVK
jgi:hypothetical protein